MEDRQLVRLAKGQIDYWHETAHKINSADAGQSYWKKPDHKAGYTDAMLSLVMVRLGEVERKLDKLLSVLMR